MSESRLEELLRNRENVSIAKEMKKLEKRNSILQKDDKTEVENPLKDKWKKIESWFYEYNEGKYLLWINSEMIEKDIYWKEVNGNSECDLITACEYCHYIEDILYEGILDIKKMEKQIMQVAFKMRAKYIPDLDEKYDPKDEEERRRSTRFAQKNYWHVTVFREFLLLEFIMKNVKGGKRNEMYNTIDQVIGRQKELENYRKENNQATIYEQIVKFGRKRDALEADFGDIVEISREHIEKILEIKKAFQNEIDMQKSLFDGRYGKKVSIILNEPRYRQRKDGKVKKNPLKAYMNKIAAIIDNYRDLLDMEKVEKKSFGEELDEVSKSGCRREAEKIAFSKVFQIKESSLDTWFQYTLYQFYYEVVVNSNRPISDIEKEWFIFYEGNINRWGFKETALKRIIREDTSANWENLRCLVEYWFTVRQDDYGRIYEEISRNAEVQMKELEIICRSPNSRLITRLLKEKDIKTMSPFVSFVIWKASKVPLKAWYKITECTRTGREHFLEDIYENKVETSIYDFLWYSRNHGEVSYEELRHAFWLQPVQHEMIRAVNIASQGKEYIKLTIDFASAIREPLELTLPTSGGMRSLYELKPETVQEIVDAMEFSSRTELFRYCADFIVKRYCSKFLGMNYYEYYKRRSFAENAYVGDFASEESKN